MAFDIERGRPAHTIQGETRDLGPLGERMELLMNDPSGYLVSNKVALAILETASEAHEAVFNSLLSTIARANGLTVDEVRSEFEHHMASKS
jgi:hypothetical protein